ncbi:hypothetical protein ACFOG5_01170 [Pedobacter fastidiosus]|uniref:hypothetical protein n=1 Tax=Pedobacter fastidiosus TaxID=2765361 RepID=UPI0036190B64
MNQFCDGFIMRTPRPLVILRIKFRLRTAGEYDISTYSLSEYKRKIGRMFCFLCMIVDDEYCFHLDYCLSMLLTINIGIALRKPNDGNHLVDCLSSPIKIESGAYILITHM